MNDENDTVNSTPSLAASIASRIEADLPGSIVESGEGVDMPCLRVVPAQWVAVCRWLRDAEGCRYRMISDLTCVDHLGREPRFDVVCHLYSFESHSYLRVKVGVPESPCECPTLTGVWPGANWLEREVFDLFGITFTGHPDPRRIVSPEGWPYFALRRDFPLQGPGSVKLYNSVSDIF